MRKLEEIHVRNKKSSAAVGNKEIRTAEIDEPLHCFAVMNCVRMNIGQKERINEYIYAKYQNVSLESV